MRWTLIESVTLDKPAFGEPCNGCGLCCISEVCSLGVALGDDRNCKALISKPDGSFSCGLVEAPYRYASEERLAVWKAIDTMSDEPVGEQALSETYADMLGAGRGCDSDDETALELLAEARRFRQLALPIPGVPVDAQIQASPDRKSNTETEV